MVAATDTHRQYFVFKMYHAKATRTIKIIDVIECRREIRDGLVAVGP